MGNRHGSEKPKEDKKAKDEKKKKKKEKKSKHKGKKKLAGGWDVDVDMESSHVSHADSESMVFHSAENLSPYLDASTRSEEGAACAGFQDNGHVLSSRDFHDGFSIEACLPADLAAIGRISDSNDVTCDGITRGACDDVNSVASGGYSTPLLSSPQVRRGVPRSPLAQRPKDSFLEPVPPIPSDFSSNTLSSAASGHEDLPSSGERSSSRASSSTIDTNPAHCIERLEELERNIERTIIEKFSDGTSPLLRRRAVRDSGEGSREGSVTPKRLSGGAVDSPSASRKANDASRSYNREGSATPKGIVRGVPSQSAENSPVILRKAYPNHDSPSLARRTPTSHGSPSVGRRTPSGHGSPSLSRATPTKADSPVVLRRQLNTPESPSTARRTPESPRLQQKHVGSPRACRRRAPESPLIRRKGVPLSEDSSSTDQDPPYSSKDASRGRGRLPGFQDNQSPHKSPSRSPEVRKKPGTKTPSSSPSPRSLGKKSMTSEDKKPAAGSTSPATQIKFCELNKGTPIKHCIVSTQPSTAVVLTSINLSQESADTSDTQRDTNRPFDASLKHGTQNSSQKQQRSQSSPEKSNIAKSSAVSEEAIKESSETAVFGSVSPKLKRQKNILEQSSSKDSFERERAGSLDSNTRSPPCSPPLQRFNPLVHAATGTGGCVHRGVKANTGTSPQSLTNIISTHNVNVIEYKKSSEPTVCISTLKYPPTPEAQRSGRTDTQQGSENNDEQSFIASNIAGRMTFHSQLSVENVGSPQNDDHRGGKGFTSQPAMSQKGYMSPPQKQNFRGREHSEISQDASAYRVTEPVYSRIQKNHTEKVEPPVVAKRPVFHTTRSIDEGTTVFSTPNSGAERGTFTRANTVPTPAWTGESEAISSGTRAVEQRSFSPGSTVQWNAPRHGGTAEGQTSVRDENAHPSPHTSAHSQNVRACGERGARAKHAPSSRSLSDASSTTSGGISKKNLGQRIRDVINESSYKEVFTAELSPTCSSDDPDHIPHIDSDWDNFPSQFRSRPAHHGYSGSSVDSYEDYRQRTSDCDSPYYSRSPPIARKTVTKVSAEKKTEVRKVIHAEKKCEASKPSTGYDRDTSLSSVAVQENVSYLPESITIRRIDVDANVTLPCQPQFYLAQTTTTTPAFSAVSAHVAPSSWHSARENQFTAGAVPEMMDSSVDPDVTSHTGDASTVPHDSSTQQQDPGGAGTQTTTRETRGRSEHTETIQAESTPTTKKEKQTAKKQSVSDRDKNTTGEKADKQMSVSESGSVISPSPSRASQPPSQKLSPSPSSHPASSTVPMRAPQADVNTARQLKQDKKKGATDSNIPAEPASAALVSNNNTAERQNRATNVKTNGGAKISTVVQLSDRGTKNTSLTSHTANQNVADRDAAGNAMAAVRPAEISTRVDKNGIAKSSQSVNPKPKDPPFSSPSLGMGLPDADASGSPKPEDGAETGNPKQNDNEEGGKEVLPEHVPPPSPTTMDLLAEEDEEEEDEDMFSAHRDSDISFMISKEMQQFGETVVKRLSSLLESQASESDSCLEDGRPGDRGRGGASDRNEAAAKSVSKLVPKYADSGEEGQCEHEHDGRSLYDAFYTHISSHRPSGKISTVKSALNRNRDDVPYVEEDQYDAEDFSHVLDDDEQQDSHDPEDSLAAPEHSQLKLTPSFPSADSFLTESDTTELSETQDTATSSNRASTASTATDETLTSFKTRSTTDSADYDEAHFVLPESLVFVRSVDEDDGHRIDEPAVVESGSIVKKPSIPKELAKSAAAAADFASSLGMDPFESQPHKPRKKRRRQPASAYDNVTRGDLIEPEPKRGSKQIRDVINAYCDESEESDEVSSGNEGACFRDALCESDGSSAECQAVQRRKEYVEQQVYVRKPKPPADRSTESSEEESASDVAASARRKRHSSSSVDSSLRIPEIEETFSELMGVKTFLEDLQDKTPTAESLPVFVGSDELKSREYWSASNLRRSRTSPAKTDRTESDLDVSEQRDDASTDSMYADDEDEGTEVVFQRSYSEEHGGEVVLSCTIYNSTHGDNDADSDDFWAESSAAEESYRKLETAADEAGSAFQNARLQMHDIHQHLQDLRRQMELLHDDITSTSLTLTPDYSLESCEPRPVMTE